MLIDLPLSSISQNLFDLASVYSKCFFILVYSCFMTPFTINSLCFFIPTVVITGLLIFKSIKSNNRDAFTELSKLVKIQFFTATVWLYIEVIL